jgi:hypothetical protein
VARIKRNEVIESRWVYRIPKTEAKQVLPLPRMALDLLDQCPDIGEYYFGDESICASPKTRLKQRLDERLGLEEWVFHDFRRAFMTHLRELGVPFDLVDQIQRPLAHRDTAGGKHYDLSVRPDDKGEVLEFWAYVMNGWLAKREPIRWRDWLNGADNRLFRTGSTLTRNEATLETSRIAIGDEANNGARATGADSCGTVNSHSRIARRRGLVRSGPRPSA